MPFTPGTRRLLMRCGVLLLHTACGPAPAPEPPPAPAPPPAPTASPTPTASTAAPAPGDGTPSKPKEDVAAVDYGSPPKAPCIDRDRVPPPPAPRAAPDRKTQKHAKAREILESGAMFVELDPRKAGVVVPPRYDTTGRLVLVVGYHLPQPIPDLAVDAEGISGQLLFKMNRFSVRIPWDAVFGLANEQSKVVRWIEDIPEDVLCPDDEPIDDIE